MDMSKARLGKSSLEPICIISNILLGISALMGVVSAIIYYKESRNVIDFTK